MGNISSITKLRKKKGITISELAREVGVSEATICRYEHGDRKMPVEMAKKIAVVLNVDQWWKLYD